MDNLEVNLKGLHVANQSLNLYCKCILYGRVKISKKMLQSIRVGAEQKEKRSTISQSNAAKANRTISDAVHVINYFC